MIKTFCTAASILCLMFVTAAPASAAFTFSYRSSVNAGANTTPGDTLLFPAAAVGSSSSVVLTIQNTYPANWTLTSASTTSPLFTVLGAGAVLAPGGNGSLTVTMTPQSAATSSGTLTLRLTGPNAQTALAVFNLSGPAVDGILTSYILNPGGNETALVTGGTLPFPPTAVGSSITANFTVSNLTATGTTLNTVTFSGDAFQVTGLPLFPKPLPANGSLSFAVSFHPASNLVYSGALTVVVGGVTRTFSLQGEGRSAVTSFQLTSGDTVQSIVPGATIPLGALASNSGRATSSLAVTNSGNTNAQVSGIFVNSTDFQVLDLPPLPATLLPGGVFSFTVAFVPKKVGDLSATLTVGNSSFTVTGTGLGPNFSYALILGAQKIPIDNGATVNIPNTQVGAKTPFSIEAVNTGNQAATLTSIGYVGGGLANDQLPAVPLTVPVGGTIQIPSMFAPTSTGIVNGYLQLQNQLLPMRAVGDPPAGLPAVRFTGIAPQMQPLLQPAVGLQLENPYPYDLTGFLTITFVPTVLGDDPSIQFVNGLRYVTFRIPANATEAVFTSAGGPDKPTALFQTGTSAGVITLSATFAVGSYDLTSNGPIGTTIQIPEDVPVIRSVQVGSQSAGGFSLLITGFSTPRSIDKLQFQLTPTTGSGLQTVNLSADVKSDFDKWFQSTAGGSFGSQFSLSISFNVNGSLGAIKSVGVAAENSKGLSAAVTANIN